MIDAAPYQRYCETRKAAHQFRSLQSSEILSGGRMRREGKNYINFASNDYLGLSQHPALIKRARECAELYGTGATASRHVTGNHPLYDVVEQKLAQGKGTEAAIVFASGYQANLTVLAALADSGVIGKPVAILADRLSHHSLLQGGLLATAGGKATLTRYHHNDYAHLESLLCKQAEKNSQSIIVTESVFGMDGDCADLEILAKLSEQFNALLYVDEAHSTGLYGAGGFGFCADHAGHIDVVMGTFGKALGSFGSYIACSDIMRDYLLQRCGGLIYSTALPPMVLGAIDAALDLLPQLDSERAALHRNSIFLRSALKQQGWNCGDSTSHIIPILLGDEEAATKLAAALRGAGILVPAIRPPTVPHDTSRLRVSLSSAHDVDAINYLINTMASLL